MENLNYTIITSISTLLIVAACFLLYVKKVPELISKIMFSIGLVLQIIFVVLLWNHLERPPMRTLGETRLWYALFLNFIGFISYFIWRYKWFLVYCASMAFLFSLLNLIFPENFDKALMPALVSIWFVPHVIVYILGYALLAASTLVAVKYLYFIFLQKKVNESLDNYLQMADNLVYLGFSFLTLGLLFGAMWAKEAWGHYWTWDPKEIWAFITWLSYLLYMHYRISRPKQENAAVWMLAFAFVFLLIAWMGINYLPSAQNSVHVYGA